jgi:hypothetical protein
VRILKRSTRSIAVVVLLAVIALGAAPSEASAAMGKAAWEKLSRQAQAGYIVGFLDCLRIAKGMEPMGYLAKAYVMPPRAKPRDWLAMVNQLYKEKEHEKRRLSQVLAIAGDKLSAKYGAEHIHGPAGLSVLRREIEKRRAEARNAKGVAGEGSEGSGDGGNTGGAKGGTDASQATEGTGAGEPADVAKAGESGDPGAAGKTSEAANAGTTGATAKDAKPGAGTSADE